jgi:hypothetical protein
MRLPIVDQSAPLVSYFVDQDVFGEELPGFFVVEHSKIDGDYYIWPECYDSAQSAHEAIAAI